MRTWNIKIFGWVCGVLLLPAGIWAAPPLKVTPAPLQPRAAGAEKTPSTLDNLVTAYRGEANAQAEYLAFAEKAEAEGYHKVAQLFKGAAMSEGIRAANHAAMIKRSGRTPSAELEQATVGTTRENLEAALKGAKHGIETMYPAFLKQAEAENNAKARMTFRSVLAVETGHALLYAEALSHLKSWKKAGDIFVCQICGNMVEVIDFQYCPVCKQPASEYVKID